MNMTAEQVRELMEDHSSQYQSTTDPYVWITEYDYRAIADELNAATVGRGTCQMTLAWGDKYEGYYYKCSACGEMAVSYYKELRYCPYCGRRAVGK